MNTQGITVNLRQVSRAKALAEKRLREGSDTEDGSESGRAGEGKGKGPVSGKRRKGSPVVPVPNLSAEGDDQVRE